MASTHWSPTAPSPRRPDKLRRLQTLPDVPRARGSLRTPRCVSLGLCLLSASHPLGLLEESVLGKRGRPRFVTVCLPYPSWSVTPPAPEGSGLISLSRCHCAWDSDCVLRKQWSRPPRAGVLQVLGVSSRSFSSGPPLGGGKVRELCPFTVPM